MPNDDKKMDPQEIAKNNPLVDLEKVNRAQDAIRRLRRAGIERSEYGLGSPYARKPQTVNWWRRDR